MLEGVEMVEGDGSIDVKRLVTVGADEELHGNGECGAHNDEVELRVAKLGSREPWWRSVGGRAEGVKLDVVKEVP